MYVSSFLTLDTALSGVEAAQEQMDTTGENISNANTAGYEEQTVSLTEATSLDISGAAGGGALQLGEGVTSSGVSNAADPYLDSAARQANANASAATVTQNYLTQIQNALGSTSSGSGINTELATFWSDWNTLADNPTSAAAQQAVVSDGETLAQSFNSLSSDVNGSDPLAPTSPTNSSSVLGQVNNEYQGIMEGSTGPGGSGGQLYTYAYQIAALNQEIVQAQAGGQSANALIDQRDAALNNLSALGNVQVQNDADGAVTVYFGGVGGTALVSDPQSGAASTSSLTPPGDNFGTYATSAGAPATGWVGAFQNQYATAGVAGTSAAGLATTVGGTLGALIGLAGYSYTPATTTAPASGAFGNLGTPVTDSSGQTTYPGPVAATELGTIGTLSASLDSVASTLMSEVNSPTVASTSSSINLLADFFVAPASSTSTATAANISVSSSLLAAAAQGIAPGQFTASTTTPPDNGVNNLQVSSLFTGQQGSYSSDNDVALDESDNSGGAADAAYAGFVQQVGSLVQGANDTQSTTSALQTQVTNQQQSVEGVDLSQEMANLISEQQAYQASAQVMNAFSTVMNSLISTVSR
ncbi:MAG: flagellar hook-associated protein FlgK [Solirubrobacteraceae bacterium]